MSVEHALKAYKKERLNCAQSILRAFQTSRNISEEDIIRADQLGGGQAEGGQCGALYAALQLFDTDSIRLRLREAFIAKAGSDKCGDIGISCVECVRLAASLVIDHGDASPCSAPAAKG